MLRNRILGTTLGLLAVCACSSEAPVDTNISRTGFSLTTAKLSTHTVNAVDASKITAKGQVSVGSNAVITGKNVGTIAGKGSSGTTSGGTTGGATTIGAGPTIGASGTTGSSTTSVGTYEGDSFVWSGPSGMTTCPTLPALSTGHFESTPIFEGSAALPELAQHCLFTWYATAPGLPPEYQALAKRLSSTFGSQPAPVLDRAVVAPLADAPPSLLQALVDQVSIQTSPAPASLPTLSRVRVAIVDTAALPYHLIETDTDGRSIKTDTYGHGRLMGRLVHKLACAADDASCPIDIANHLALPYIKAGTLNNVRGGFFGTRVQVARAINRALADWGNAALAAGGPVPPLVINLSIGWDPIHEIGTPTYGPSAMVYLALERAACMGAAVVAAAGNTAGDSRSGFMLPARWHSMPTPSAARCGKIAGLPFDGPGLTRPSAGATGRLLEAVGAVDVYDQPLATTRQDATPRFVAYGEAAVTSDARTDFTDVLGGSSVSTAVLSAAVASVWSVVPSKSPADVLQMVFDASVSLDRPVEPCTRAGCDQVRRVAVCDAARDAACTGPGCEGVAACSTVPARAGKTALASFAFSEADYPSVAATSCDETGECDNMEGPGYGHEPWVGPQPDPQTCPYCFINLNWGRGFFTLPPTLRSASSMQLELSNGSRYQIGGAGAALPDTFSVSLSRPDTSRASSARLLSVIGDGHTARVTETPLHVVY